MVFQNSVKAYPAHRDTFTYAHGAVDWNEEWLRLRENGPESFKLSLPEKPLRKVHPFQRRQRPNFNDPFVLFYVLDVLVNSAPGTYLRPAYLVPHLNTVAAGFYWTTDIVGRILAGIWEASIATYLNEEDSGGMEYIPSHDGEGNEIPEERRMRYLPFSMGRDAKGKYYVVDPLGSYEGRFWLLKFRLEVSKVCFKAEAAEREGHLGAQMAKEKSPAPVYIAVSPDPIVSAQAYRASCTPAANRKQWDYES